MVQAQMARTVAGSMNDGDSAADGQDLAACKRPVHACSGRMGQHMQKSPLPLLGYVLGEHGFGGYQRFRSVF
ncbi:hypothetical protein D3C73_1504590 [compost metagenome]